MTRMPFAASSIVVVRSPVWSWMRARPVVRRARTGGRARSTGIAVAIVSSAERHVEVEEQREDRDHLDDDDDEEDRAERREAADQRDVGARAREQLARLPAVVEADLEPLEVLVEVVAQLGLDVGRDVREARRRR